MILIPCPHCGPRNSSEFAHAGERRPRPDPNAATPAEWRAYLYDKRNPAGWRYTAPPAWIARTVSMVSASAARLSSR
jgi:heterotetrameric sarcosine oxidase delta subunit